MDIRNLEEVRAFFGNDRYAADAGCFIEEIGDEYAKISLTIDERHKNAVGGVMGGVYFTIADFAFAVATNRLRPGTVSVSADITFVGTPKTEKIFAETEKIKDGRSTCCHVVRVYDALENPLAVVKFLGFHKE